MKSVFDLPKRTVGLLDRARSTPPRAFTPAEKALIGKVHGYMPAPQLLSILNERLAGDLGAAVAPHSIEQLHAEIAALADAAPPAGGQDWSSLRKLVARAKRDGVLEAITAQRIDDFAVVFSLSAGQVLRLQDVLLDAKEGGQ